MSVSFVVSLYHSVQEALARLWNLANLGYPQKARDTLRCDRLCGQVVTVLGYRSGGPASIPGTTRFSGGGGKENK
jgi:hypothetical protein